MANSPILRRTLEVLSDDGVEVSDRGVRDTTDALAFEAPRAAIFANTGTRLIAGIVADAALVKATSRNRSKVAEVRAALADLPVIDDPLSARETTARLDTLMNDVGRVKGLETLAGALSEAKRLALLASLFDTSQQARFKPQNFAENFANLVNAATKGLDDDSLDKRAIIGLIQEAVDASVRVETGELANISPTLEVFARDLGLEEDLLNTGSLGSVEDARARLLGDFVLHRLAPKVCVMAGIGGARDLALPREQLKQGFTLEQLIKSADLAEVLAGNARLQSSNPKMLAAADLLDNGVALVRTLTTMQSGARFRSSARFAALAVKFAVAAGMDAEAATDAAANALARGMVAE